MAPGDAGLPEPEGGVGGGTRREGRGVPGADGGRGGRGVVGAEGGVQGVAEEEEQERGKVQESLVRETHTTSFGSPAIA